MSSLLLAFGTLEPSILLAIAGNVRYPMLDSTHIHQANLSTLCRATSCRAGAILPS
jgi:hypothetical protein